MFKGSEDKRIGLTKNLNTPNLTLKSYIKKGKKIKLAYWFPEDKEKRYFIRQQRENLKEEMV
jgi:hypothetical protein